MTPYFGADYKTPFLFEVFETRNTCTERTIPIVGKSIASAREAAKRLSMKYHHVVVSLPTDGKQAGKWEEYEKGEKVSWSHPNGLQNCDIVDCSICKKRIDSSCMFCERGEHHEC